MASTATVEQVILLHHLLPAGASLISSLLVITQLNKKKLQV
jgi:hypothetical protein